MVRSSTQARSRKISAAQSAAGEPMPRDIEPMLAVLSDLPGKQEKYNFEFKWDGVRAIGYFDGRQLTFQSRNLLDITPRYPELQGLAKALKGRRAVLDGEVVALDEEHRPS